MPRVGITVYDLLVSCPGDVIDIIEIIRDSVDSFNRAFGRRNNIEIVINYWKTHSYPQFGSSPQEILNEQFVKDCDLAIAIFGTRFGTPTDRYYSGTEEEIEDMVNSGKQVFVYFLNRKINPSEIDLEQYNRVQIYKKECQKKGLYSEVSDAEELRIMFENHLNLYFSSIKKPLLDISQVLTMDRIDIVSCLRRLSIGEQIDDNKLLYIKNLEELDLSKLNIGELPTWIENLVNLRKLNLQSTKISKLPRGLSRLQNLQELNLCANPLYTLPKWIDSLQSLETLNLGYTRIKKLPLEIGQLKKLKILQMHNTVIRNLPEEMKHLRSLQYLNLSNTLLEELPEWMKELSALEDLHLFGVPITKLPEWISELDELHDLNISNTKISQLPITLSNMKNIEKIRICNLKLESLPQYLEKLDLPYIKDGISGSKPGIYIKGATLLLDDSYDDCDNKMVKDFFG